MFRVSSFTMRPVNALFVLFAVACESSTPSLGPVASDPCLEHPKKVASLPSGGDYTAASVALDEGLAAQQAGDPLRAQEHLLRAIDLDPGLGLAYLTLTEIQLYLGAYPEERQQHAARALLLLPENPRAHLRYAEVQYEKEAFGVAAIHARCAVSRRPEYVEAQILLARIESQAQRPQAALAAATEATRLAPQNHTAWVLRSKIEEATGDFKAAAASMEQAALGVGSSPPLFRRAAQLADRAGDPASAEALNQRADALQPPPEKRKLRPLRKKRRRRKR